MKRKEDRLFSAAWCAKKPVCVLTDAYPKPSEEKEDYELVEGKGGQMEFNTEAFRDDTCSKLIFKYVNEGYDKDKVRQKLASMGFTERFEPKVTTPFILSPINPFYQRMIENQDIVMYPEEQIKPYSLAKDFNGDTTIIGKVSEKNMLSKNLRVVEAYFRGKAIHKIECDFAENNRAVLAQDIGVILGIKACEVYKAINSNRDMFGERDILDIKSCLTRDKELCSSLGIDYGGLTIYNIYEHIYILSESGYTILMKILIDDSDLAKSKASQMFKEAYFNEGAANEEGYYVDLDKVKKDSTIDEKPKNEEVEQLKEYIIKYEASYMLPRKYVTEDIMNFVTKHVLRKPGIATRRDVLYRNYLAVSPKREVNVPLSMFEDVMYELGFKTGADYWKATHLDDIKVK